MQEQSTKHFFLSLSSAAQITVHFPLGVLISLRLKRHGCPLPNKDIPQATAGFPLESFVLRLLVFPFFVVVSSVPALLARCLCFVQVNLSGQMNLGKEKNMFAVCSFVGSFSWRASYGCEDANEEARYERT